MNILFLTLVSINSIEDRGIYQDLLRKFRNEGHHVIIVTPVERRDKTPTNLQKKEGITLLQVRTFNVKKTNIIEKGIGTLALEYQYLWAIKKHFKNIKFDLVLYSTPPITLVQSIRYIKNRDDAYTYLLLKDIFPQNAVDMDMIRKNGILHRVFTKKEKELYSISDTIGCMSQANVDFILKNNPEVHPSKVEANPNSIEPVEICYTKQESQEIRNKYGVPLDKKVFVYGGNLGKPQGLDFLLETIANTTNEEAYFLVVGNGTEFSKLRAWFNSKKPVNAKLLQRLPKADYDQLLASCDVGLIFLDKKFTIPNFPSRLLSYLEMKKPVITATDPNTDVGDVVEKHQCGIKVLAGDHKEMQRAISFLLSSNLKILGENGFRLLEEKYLVNRSFSLIIDKLKNRTVRCDV